MMNWESAEDGGCGMAYGTIPVFSDFSIMTAAPGSIIKPETTGIRMRI